MDEENFKRDILKLHHDIEQLDAKIEDKVSSLSEEFHKELWEIRLEEKAHTSVSYINTLEIFFAQVNLKDRLETCSRVHQEIVNLFSEYFRRVNEASAAECEKIVQKFTSDVNRLTRAAGLGELWKPAK